MQMNSIGWITTMVACGTVASLASAQVSYTAVPLADPNSVTIAPESNDLWMEWHTVDGGGGVLSALNGAGGFGAKAFILGSSSAEGYGATPGNSWRAKFTNWFHGQTTTFAVGGRTISYSAPLGYPYPGGWDAPSLIHNVNVAINQGATLIIINFPSNFVARPNATVQNYMNTALAITNACEAAGVDYRIFTTQPRNYSTQQQRNILADAASALVSTYGSRSIPTYWELADPQGYIKPEYDLGDGVHMNDAGYHFLYTQLIDSFSSDPIELHGTVAQSDAGVLTATAPGGIEIELIGGYWAIVNAGDPFVPDCYANCDGSTTQPLLNIEDFACFINQMSIAMALPHEEQITHYANCDGSTVPPVLNVDDFACFINAFAAGCP